MPNSSIRTRLSVTPEEHLEVRLTAPLDEQRAQRPVGYYLFVRIHSTYWKPLLVRFVRAKDADLARLALLRAELFTLPRLERTGAGQVYRLMMEALQW